MSQPWVPTTVVIDCPQGRESVLALTHRLVPGLAVTMRPFGFFSVTHVASGRRIGHPYERCVNALLHMARLTRCFDWAPADPEAIKKQVELVGHEPVPFDGYTVTGRDGTERPYSKREFMESVVRHGILPYATSPEFPWESSEDDPALKAENLLAVLSGEPTQEGT